MADRFFIILRGEVAIYRQRDEVEIKRDSHILAELRRRAQEVGSRYPRDKYPLKELVDGKIAVSEMQHVYGMKHSKLEYLSQFVESELVHFKKSELSSKTKIFHPESGILMFKCIAVLGEGQMFGEKGLDEGAPRMATVLCTQDSDFGYLLKQDYDLCLKPINRQDNERRKTFLFKNVFKTQIPISIISKLAFDFYKRKLVLRRNECLFKQGDCEKLISILRFGQIQIEKVERELSITAQGAHQRPAVRFHKLNIGFMYEGEVLGEEFLFSSAGSEFTVRVVSESATFLQVTHECMLTYMKLEPNLADFFRQLIEVRKERRRTTLGLMKCRLVRPANRESVGGHELDTSLARSQEAIATAKKKPLITFSSFREKYETTETQFLKTYAPQRFPKYEKLSDAESILNRTYLTSDERLDSKSAITRHFKSQEKVLDNICKQREELKQHERKNVIKKFNMVLRQQIAKSQKHAESPSKQPQDQPASEKLSFVADMMRKIQKKIDIRSFRSQCGSLESPKRLHSSLQPRKKKPLEKIKGSWNVRSVNHLIRSAGNNSFGGVLLSRQESSNRNSQLSLLDSREEGANQGRLLTTFSINATSNSITPFVVGEAPNPKPRFKAKQSQELGVPQKHRELFSLRRKSGRRPANPDLPKG